MERPAFVAQGSRPPFRAAGETFDFVLPSPHSGDLGVLGPFHTHPASDHLSPKR
jgi:hypothetical protein